MSRAVDVAGRGVRVSGRSVGAGSAIPDVAVARYYAPSISASDTQSLSSWDDSENNNNLSGGSPTYQTNVQSGNAVVRWDGSTDILGTDITDISQPYTILAVVVDAAQNSTDFERIVSFNDSNDNDVSLYWDKSNQSWSISSGIVLGGDSTSAPVILSAVFDGSNSELRVNGSATTGDAGTKSIQSIALGANTGPGNVLDGDIGESLLYDADLRATNELSNEETRVSNDWGIPIP